jgi:hypothetical protein
MMGRYCSVRGDVIGAVLFIIVDSVWMVWLFNYECVIRIWATFIVFNVLLWYSLHIMLTALVSSLYCLNALPTS